MTTLDPRAVKAALDAYGIDAVVDGLEAAIAAYLAATQPQAGEPVEAQIADAVLGWMVKFDLLDAGNEYGPDDVLAVLNDLAPSPQPAKDEREVPSNCAPAQDDGVHIHTTHANPAQVTDAIPAETLRQLDTLFARTTQGSWRTYQNGVHPVEVGGMGSGDDYAICTHGPKSFANADWIATMHDEWPRVRAFLSGKEV